MAADGALQTGHAGVSMSGERDVNGRTTGKGKDLKFSRYICRTLYHW